MATPNPFDQFDEVVPTPTPQPAANPFDQFDAPPVSASANPFDQFDSLPPAANAPAVAAPQEDASLWNVFTNSASRGWRGLKQLLPTLEATGDAALLNQIEAIDRGEQLTPEDVGVIGEYYLRASPEARARMRKQYGFDRLPADIGENLLKVGQLQKEKEAFPMPASAQAVSKAQSFGEALSRFSDHPLEFLASVGPESLIQSAPGLLAAIPAAAAGPGGPMATIGLNSFATEIANGVMSELAERGIDTTNPQAIQAALSDRALLDEITTKMTKRAAVVGGVDALSGGVASKTLLPAKVLAERPIARKAAEMAVQTPIGMAMGAGGEAGGQLAEGGPLRPGEIFAEAAGEMVGTPAEVAALQLRALKGAVKGDDTKGNVDVESTPEQIDAILGRTQHGARTESTKSKQPATPSPPSATMPSPADTGSPPPGSGGERVTGAPKVPITPTAPPAQGSAIPPTAETPAPQEPAAPAQKVAPPKTEVPPAQTPPPVTTPAPAPQADTGEQPGEVKAGGTTAPALTAAPTSQPAIETSEGDRTRDKFKDVLGKAVQRMKMEEQGQAILDDLEENNESPRSVAQRFWSNTYWNMSGDGQQRFNRYLKSLGGLQPGDVTSIGPNGEKTVANDWRDIADFVNEDLADKTSDLEGITRGYVALMEWANQQANQRPPEAATQPAAPTLPAPPAALPAPASQTPVSKRDTAPTAKETEAQAQIAKLEKSAAAAEKKGDAPKAAQLRAQANKLRKSSGPQAAPTIEQKPAPKRAGKPESTISRLNENAPGYTVEESNAPDDADSGMTVEEGNEDAQAEFERLQREQAERNAGTVGETKGRGAAGPATHVERGAERSANRPQVTQPTARGRETENTGRDTTRGVGEVPTDRRGVEPTRQKTGRTASGKPPRQGWRTLTKVRTKDGQPRKIFRGGGREVTAEHFSPEALGRKTKHPSSSLGVFSTESERQATRWGVVRAIYLDIRNPKVIDNHELDGFDTPEQAAAYREQLKADGFDGIHLRNREVGAPDWFIAFYPDQVIHEAGDVETTEAETSEQDTREAEEITLESEEREPEEITLETPPDEDANDGGTLTDQQLPAKTGRAPTGPAVAPRAGTDPSDPLRLIAARKAREARAAIERKDTTPKVAPKRDTKLGRSTFDSMWRDLLGMPEVGPQTQENEEKLRRIQGSPMAAQLKIGTKALNERFAFQKTVIDPKLSSREAMDVLLDAYNNLHTMANVMSLPREAMGFNGDLTLQLSKSIGKSKGTRGSFEWSFAKGFNEAVITLARRADSFTHEWIHALDLNLLMRFYKSRVAGVSALSAYTTKPLDALPPAISKAFTDVMRSLFLVDEAAAQTMAELTAKAALKGAALEKAKSRARGADAKTKTEREAEVETAKRELADTLAAITELLNKGSSQLHQGSRYVDALSGGEYFSIPTEMLARAGEAWMGNRIGQQGGTEFLSGSPNFYNNNADRIMQLVYPNAAEREGIFQKFDALFAALAKEQYFKGETVAARIPGETMFDKELAQAAMENEQAGAFKRAYDSVRNDFVNLAMAVATVFKGDWIGDAASGARGAIDNFKRSSMVTSFWSAIGRVDSLTASYKGNPKAQALLRQFARKLGLNPGAREETEGATVQDRIDRNIRRYQKELDNIVKAHKLDPSNPKQMAALYEEAARPTEQVRQELKDHNEFLQERLTDPELTDAERAHVHSNIRANNEILRKTPLPKAPEVPIQKAALAIRKLQDRLFYDAQQAGIDIGYVSNYMRRALSHEAIAEDHAGFIAKATLAYEATNALNVRRLERAITRAKTHRAKVELQAELTATKRLDPKRQAEDYLLALTVPDVHTPQGMTTPSTKFTKHRTLAPAADLLLADYYDQNPVRSLYNSISASVYRTTYAEMFGANGEQLDVMRKDMLAAGVKPTDLPILDDALRIAFGQTGNFVSTTDAFVNWAMLLAQIKLLGRSAFTNFMEPAVSGLRTGNLLDSVEAIARTYLPVLNRAEAAEQQFVMETLGLVASTAHETVFANRSGMSGDNALLRTVYTGFGKLSKLQWLTERGRAGSFRVLANYLHFISLQVAEGKGDRARESHDELNELGIPREKHAEFAEFMRGLPKGRMGMDMLMRSGDQEMKELYGSAMHVLLRQSIQDAQRVERARGSFHPMGRFIFSITNFTRSFERNVIARNAKLIYTAEGIDRKALAFGRFGSTAGALVLLTVISSMARDWWDDPERAKKKLKDNEYFSGKGILSALDRAGFTGRFTLAYNAYAKEKFDREVSALTAGAVPSFYIDSFVKMGYGFKEDASAKQERAAWSAFYDLTVGIGAPLAAIAAKATGPIGWTATTKLQSRGVKDAFAESMVPQTLEERADEAREQERANESPAETARRDRASARAKETRQRNLQRKFGESP